MVLLLALCVLVAVMLMGVSAAQLALQGEKAARGERDRLTALQAAEEALMDAENDIEGAGGASARGAMFAPGSAQGFAAGCASAAAGAGHGLCLRPAEGETPLWQSVDFDDDAATARSVPYGKFTGAQMVAGEGLLPFRRPRYIIELLPDPRQAQGGAPPPRYIYRVTAVGFGARAGREVLQRFHRKYEPPAGEPGDGSGDGDGDGGGQ
ncbi:type IV pilus assembly protein PilX [Janthinobacterium sp. CG_23.3]|uniref:pilus assembly PilX family protein n=1 Tax=Janthinobacterium sp. CG_23.3 TaxID=3349634 RepID=UPI0038D3D1C7